MIKVGSRFRSQVCDAEVVVIRARDGDVDLRCGGHSMVALGGDTSSAEVTLDAAHAGGAVMGKRYVDRDATTEVLVTRAGAGSLSLRDESLILKEAKPLPASD